ncbi:hypothetical protein QVA66_10935 [Staphylococcus chromogenes]|nr:hypothetical protein [Staphylococcus chromogenes]
MQNQLEVLGFQFATGSQNHFSFLESMWSQEKGTAYPTRRAHRTVRFKAFERSGAISRLELTPQLKDMLAIIQPLNTLEHHVAVVHGWVAIESMLVDANEDDRIGAERIAYIAAACYFRTEMTWLAVNYEKAYSGESDEAREIRQAQSSFERAKVMLQIILKKLPTEKMAEKDLLAIRKMAKAFADPGRAFARTVEILTHEFSRLYRKRNLIVHAGYIADRGIDSLAEKLIPVLVAAIDQMLVAELQYQTSPKHLAAKVEFRSSKILTPSDLIGLLELD